MITDLVLCACVLVLKLKSRRIGRDEEEGKEPTAEAAATAAAETSSSKKHKGDRRTTNIEYTLDGTGYMYMRNVVQEWLDRIVSSRTGQYLRGPGIHVEVPFGILR